MDKKRIPTGHMNLQRVGKIIRHIHSVYPIGMKLGIPDLALAAYMMLKGESDTRDLRQIERILPNFNPIYQAKYRTIFFSNHFHQRLTRISALDLFALSSADTNAYFRHLLENKIVLIGIVSQSSRDGRLTAMLQWSGNYMEMSGVEILAHLLFNYLSNQWIDLGSPLKWMGITILLPLLFLLLNGLTYRRHIVRLSLLLGLFYAGLVFAAFVTFRIYLPIVHPLLVL